jgi:hypothetical protein
MMIAPCAIRGQLIADDLVSFGGRGGDTQFLAPDPMKIVSRLPLRNPGDMRSLYALKIEEIIDYLVELGKMLDLSKNEFMQEALEHSYAVTDLTPPILRWQYSLINHFLSRDMVRDYIEVPDRHSLRRGLAKDHAVRWAGGFDPRHGCTRSAHRRRQQSDHLDHLRRAQCADAQRCDHQVAVE